MQIRRPSAFPKKDHKSTRKPKGSTNQALAKTKDHNSYHAKISKSRSQSSTGKNNIGSMRSADHLHVVVSVEGLVADRAGELGGPNEDLRRGGYPVLPFCQPPDPEGGAPHRHGVLPFILIPSFLLLLVPPFRCCWFLVLATHHCHRRRFRGAGAGQADVQRHRDLPGLIGRFLDTGAVAAGGDELAVVMVRLMGCCRRRREAAEEGEGFPDRRRGRRWV
jgi:hypothetical protein